jgi:hypothetical protein
MNLEGDDIVMLTDYRPLPGQVLRPALEGNSGMGYVDAQSCHRAENDIVPVR